MPRKPALQVAELSAHIIQRGNNRQECFFAGERDSGEGEPGRGEPGRGLHNCIITETHVLYPCPHGPASVVHATAQLLSEPRESRTPQS